jgi:hypothetical protein
MQFLIDLGSFCVEADNEDAAHNEACAMLKDDPSIVQIVGVEPA